jgi:hypothetical protein
MSAAKKPSMPAMPAMPEPPQAQKMPDEQKRRSAAGSAAGGGPIGGGNYNTMLTGPGGITNSMLDVAKNTLLGQ